MGNPNQEPGIECHATVTASFNCTARALTVLRIKVVLVQAHSFWWGAERMEEYRWPHATSYCQDMHYVSKGWTSYICNDGTVFRRCMYGCESYMIVLFPTWADAILSLDKKLQSPIYVHCTWKSRPILNLCVILQGKMARSSELLRSQGNMSYLC